MKEDKDYFMVGLILEKIYDSELHLSIGWMWDGGIDYTIGRDLTYLHNGYADSTGVRSITEAMPLIADNIAKECPDSGFAKWWNKTKP